MPRLAPLLAAISLSWYSAVAGAQAFVFGDDRYCTPFDRDVCKAGDLIVVPASRDILRYCEIDKAISLTLTENARVVCRYVGAERQNRRTQP